jgi:ribosomal protein S18 acetylase RimI-like enzyme
MPSAHDERGSETVLDDPIGASLRTSHASSAIVRDGLSRYPADVAPFVSIAAGTVAAAGRDTIAKGETTFGIGGAPPAWQGWAVSQLGAILQMTCDVPIEAPPEGRIVPLGPEHETRVLELAALVYPHYFRRRTTRLGRYFGVLEGDRLLAMAGERMGMPGHREISAVCTHPSALGRGLARSLVAFLVNDLLAHGQRPFLHVSPSNVRARELYERLGFRVRAELPFWSLARPDDDRRP